MIVGLSDHTLRSDAFVAERALRPELPEKQNCAVRTGKERSALVEVVLAVDSVVFDETFRGQRFSAFGASQAGGVVSVVHDFEDELIPDGILTLDACAENGVL